MNITKLCRRIARCAGFLLLQLSVVGAVHADVVLGPNLALTGPGAGADGSGFSNAKTVRDGDFGTASYASGTSNQRIAVKWNGALEFNTVVLYEEGENITGWELNDHSTGEVLATGTTVGDGLTVNLGQVHVQKINLLVHSATGPPAIREFEVYNASGEPPVSSSSSISSASSVSSEVSSSPSSISSASASSVVTWSSKL